MMRLAQRLTLAAHTTLLRLAAPAVRTAYGDQMRDTFCDQCAHARSTWALAPLLARETFDLWRSRRPTAARDTSVRLQMPPGLWRGLRRRPGYALAVILTLALGTAGTTTLFSLVDTVIISPLPYPDGDRLVTVMEASPEAPGRGTLAAPGRIEEWHRLNTTLASIASSYAENVTDTSVPDPERLDSRRVTPRFFDVFGMAPAAGRTFTADEEAFGGPGAAVISETFWERRFTKDPNAVGRNLTIGGRAHTIVGVMPRAFTAAAIDIWLPAQIHPGLLGVRDARFVSGIGRLKSGVSVDRARADLDRVQQQLGEQFPATDRGWTSVVSDLKAARVGDRRSLWIIFAAVGVVWLIGVANVSSLVLVQVQRRTKELAIRAALGGSRAQMVGLIGLEVLLLSLTGGLLGLATATFIIGIIPSIFDSLPRLNELTMDGRALAFALGTSILAAMAGGIVPALAATRRHHESSATRSGRSSIATATFAQRALVAAQVALGVVLCAAAGLFAGSYYGLTQADLGFSTDDVVTFHVGARWDEDRTRIGEMQIALLDRVSALPGVHAAGFVNFLPSPGGSLRYQATVDGLSSDSGEPTLAVGARMIGGRYFEALGVSLKTGHACGVMHTDTERPRTAIVNERFVERYAAGQSIIGRQLRVIGGIAVPYTITGIVPNLAEDGAQVARFPFVYTCDQAGAWPDPNYVVRAADTSAVLAQLRPLVRSLDGSRAVFGVRPLDEVTSESIAGPRQQAGLVSTFALTALVLTALGLYALLARYVTDSRREIGVRLALGATRAHVVGIVAARAGLLLAIGLTVGAGLTAVAYRTLRASLHGTAAANTAALAGIVGLLILVCGVAIVIPALRAARVAPTEALSGE